MDIKIFNNTEDLNLQLAQRIVNAANEAISQRGKFDFVLSGGNTPRKLYSTLASQFQKEVDWSKVFFFFGDERFVPANDNQRNSKMAAEVLFNPLKINSSQVFLIDTTQSPHHSAKKYNEDIKNHLGDTPIFDFILLGLGDDAHTASLFPNSWELNETRPIIKETYLEQFDMYRITMTPKMINLAREVAFLVLGAGKAEAVYHVLKDKTGAKNHYPARFIEPENNNLTWYLDTAAAELL